MALSGAGIALVSDFLAEAALRDGRLKLWSSEKMSSGSLTISTLSGIFQIGFDDVRKFIELHFGRTVGQKT